MTFVDELLAETWHVFFGGPWWITVLILSVLALAILTWTGAIRSPVATSLPGSTAGILLMFGAFVMLCLGIAVYRTIWGDPQPAIVWYKLPLIALFGLAVLCSIPLFFMSKPPAFLIPRWVRERQAAQAALRVSPQISRPAWARDTKDEAP